MYRVMHNYEKTRRPTAIPSTLTPADYTVSRGTSYYDTAYIPADGDGFGAMMEHYEKYCLPIFPIKNNNYTCSFVSLGNKAYFLTYPQDRPKDMPACCMFSPMNHPPRQDFIQHLPYSAERSQNLDGSVQAYALDLQSPQGPILFGYAFYKRCRDNRLTGSPNRSFSLVTPASPMPRSSARTTPTSASPNRTPPRPGRRWPRCARRIHRPASCSSHRLHRATAKGAVEQAHAAQTLTNDEGSP